MHSPATRLLSLLELLQSHGRMTAPALARTLHIAEALPPGAAGERERRRACGCCL